MEAASTVSDPRRRQATVTFVVVGAGYVGVGLIAQMGRTLLVASLRLVGGSGNAELVEACSDWMRDVDGHACDWSQARSVRRGEEN
jgi:NADH dehydrogenase FAD-containing subunit